MGVIIPQVITPSRATGAQVIDGSLNFFQESNPYLEFTPGSDGNRSTWTISFWAKVSPNETGTYNPFTLSTSDSYAWEYEGLHYAGNDLYYIDYISQGSGANILWRTDAKFRDTGWYHFMAVKVNNSTFKLYVNGEEQTSLSSSTNNGNQSSHWNKSGQKMFLGGSAHSTGYSSHSPGMSQFYFIDGQALEPADFAFTDPLTNTWKPKKYTGTFTGTNTCYLPFDGNSPIGQDQSGNGNDWTPVNFGGSVALDNPQVSGALPILNTTQGGTQAGVGVRTDATVAAGVGTCVLALPLVGSTDDVSNQIDSRSTTKIGTNSSVTASSTQSNFYSGSHHWSAASDTLQYAEQGDELVFGTGDFTIECWLYDDNGHNGGGSGRCYIFDNRIGGSVVGDPPTMVGHCDGHAEFTFYDGDGDITYSVPSTVGKWWHYAVTREGTTTRMFIDGILRGSSTSSTNFTNNGIGVGRATDGGYGWSGYIQDFRVYNGVAKYTSDFVIPATSPDILPDTPSGVSGGSKLTKITDGAVSFDGSGDYMETATSADYQFGTGDFTVECFVYLKKDNANQIMVGNWGSSDGWQLYFTNTGDKFAWYRDGSILISSGTVIKANRWYHVAVARTGSTTKLFVDGILEGSASDSNDYAQSKPLEIGRQQSTNTNLLEGFISNIRIVKGTALYTSNFTPPTAPLTNVTNTKLLCCQSNTSATEAAVKPGTITASGDAAATNFTPFNTDINTVRGQETGYATLSPINADIVNNATLSDGNLKLIAPTFQHYIDARSTITASSIDCYCELTPLELSGAAFSRFGVGDYRSRSMAGTGSYLVYFHTGAVTRYPGNTTVATVASYTEGDVIGMTVNSTQAAFYKNGKLQGTYSHGLTGDFFVLAGAYHGGNRSVLEYNFGQKPFKFPPPDGFQPLNAANVRPETMILRPDQYVGISTWTGNGGAQTVSGLNHSPDLIWHKIRSISGGHQLYDSVRGTSKRLRSDNADDEDTVNGVTAFNFDGWSMSGGNNSGEDYVSWTWKAGGAPTATNTQSSGAMTANSVSVDGVLQSAYTPSGSPTIYPKKMSVGTKQGFSIVQYVGNDTLGATVPHGLTQAPDFFVTKAIDYNFREWQVYHQALGNQQPIRLNTTDAAQAANAGYFNNTSPTSSVVTFGNGGDANQGGETPLTYIMYAWHDVPGLQKFGSYIANNATNGPFIELGFRPAIVWLKPSTRTGNWTVIDVERDTFNVTTKRLSLNLTTNEPDQVTITMDILSNGFKCRTNIADVNNGTDTYIYCAWAEASSVDLYGGGANAR